MSSKNKLELSMNFQRLLCELTIEQFYQIALMSSVTIIKDGEIRSDYPKIEKEIMEYFCGLTKKNQERFIRVVKRFSRQNKLNKGDNS